MGAVVRQALIDNFEVIKTLGKGSFATAYLGRDVQLNVLRVIKVLNADLVASDDDDYVALFRQEAQALALINDDNVTRVFTCGTTNDARPFFVMEYLPGQDLETVLAERKAPVPISNVIKLAICMLDGLGALHQAGIVHRDIKPSNLFITRASDGAPKAKLLDLGTFSIAEHVEIRGQSAIYRGTPRYSAPEQFDCEPAAPAGDIYSVGIVLYELLTGRTPFAHYPASDFARLKQAHSTERPEPILQRRPDAPEALVHLVEKSFLEKDWKRRMSKAERAAQLLHDIQKDLDRSATETRAITFRNMELREGSTARKLSPRMSLARFVREDGPSDDPTSPGTPAANRAQYDMNATDVDNGLVEAMLQDIVEHGLAPAPEPLPPEDALRYKDDLDLLSVEPRPRSISKEKTTSVAGAPQRPARAAQPAVDVAEAFDPFPAPRASGTQALRHIPPPPVLPPLPPVPAVVPPSEDSSQDLYVPSPIDEPEEHAAAAAKLPSASDHVEVADEARPTPKPRRARRTLGLLPARAATLLIGIGITAAVTFAIGVLLLTPKAAENVDPGVEAPAAPAAPAATLASSVDRSRSAPASSVSAAAAPTAPSPSATAPEAAAAIAPMPKAKPSASAKPKNDLPDWLRAYASTSTQPAPAPPPRPQAIH